MTIRFSRDPACSGLPAELDVATTGTPRRSNPPPATALWALRDGSQQGLSLEICQ